MISLTSQTQPPLLSKNEQSLSREGTASINNCLEFIMFLLYNEQSQNSWMDPHIFVEHMPTRFQRQCKTILPAILLRITRVIPHFQFLSNISFCSFIRWTLIFLLNISQQDFRGNVKQYWAILLRITWVIPHFQFLSDISFCSFIRYLLRSMIKAWFIIKHNGNWNTCSIYSV